jgi:hypothetical protein
MMSGWLGSVCGTWLSRIHQKARITMFAESIFDAVEAHLTRESWCTAMRN